MRDVTIVRHPSILPPAAEAGHGPVRPWFRPDILVHRHACLLPLARPARHDLYGPVHKGLRLALTELLVRIGSADLRDAGATAVLVADLRAQMAVSAAHLEHEDRYVHAALESRAPGATARLAHDHDEHGLAFAEIETILKGLEAADAAARPALARDLYLRFAAFTAADLAHMNEEETVTLPLLQQMFTDEELQAIEGRILAALTPTKVMAFMRFMVPAMNRDERAGMLGAMKAAAPVEAFRAVLDHAARPTLSNDDWADLAARLQLAA